MLNKIVNNLHFIFYPLYILSFAIPKNKNIWVFGAGNDRYAENTKALFEYCTKYDHVKKFIWITNNRKLYLMLKDKGYQAEIRWSMRGVYYSLVAKYYFYNLYINDINFYTSGNAICVNLWHGIPLKKIEFDIKQGAQSKIFNSRFSSVYHFFKPFIFKKPSHVLSTSETVSNIFSSSFRISTNKCLEFGYPRCDIFFEKRYQTKNKTKKNKVIIYMPTWRNKNKNFLESAIPDLDILNAILKKNDLSMYIKLHPNTDTINKKYSNVLFIDPQEDIYDFLHQSDLLITDYSSIYFDYLLLDKEIIFYPFDYKEYIKKEREFYFDYDSFTPGEKVYTFKYLLETLNHLNKLNYSKERKILKDNLWKYQDGDASKRIYTYFT